MKINNIHFPMKTKDFTTNGLVEDVQNDSGIVFEFLTDITETSPELDEKIDEIVIQKKRELTEKKGVTWTSDGADGIILGFLCLSVDVGNKDGERFIDYSIFGEFSDISGEPWEITFDFPIDLHKYDSKVKQMVMKYLEDVLFGKTEPATINQKSQAA